jgi:hypothetical protein
MDIPVLIERSPKGFRASSQSPIPLSAEAVTETEAMDALTLALRQRLQNGSRIRTITLPSSETVEEICTRMRASPLHVEMEQAFEEYRKVANAVDDAD